jgi:hypothetical protein
MERSATVRVNEAKTDKSRGTESAEGKGKEKNKRKKAPEKDNGGQCDCPPEDY